MSGRTGANGPFWFDVTLLVLATALFVTLVGLGNWQMRRLDWKLDLVEAVETRASNTPVAPPSDRVSADDHAYLRVFIEGVFLQDLSYLVKAVTGIGLGYWLMTPLRTNRGHVWVNRGFVLTGAMTAEITEPVGVLRIEGLLRISEPGGTMLESNDPQAGRWYSRDVHALSEHAGLNDAAPYFIDADHMGDPNKWPRGGLTILTFQNPHLVYALTWYTMAALFLGAMVYVIRRRRGGRWQNNDCDSPDA